MTRGEERRIAALVRHELASVLLELLPELADRLAERLLETHGEDQALDVEALDAEDWNAAELEAEEEQPEAASPPPAEPERPAVAARAPFAPRRRPAAPPAPRSSPQGGPEEAPRMPLPVFAVPEAARPVADWLYDALRFDGLAPADARRRVAELGVGESLLAEANRRRVRRRLAPFGADGRPLLEEGASA